MTNETSSGGPVDEASAKFPRGTTPTWEIEMLLSGAVIFALMQAPDLLDAAFDSFSLKLGGTVAFVALFIYSYTKAIVYVLVLTFAAHLAARAYWIALVGLDSVYPQGARWENAKIGPLLLGELAHRDRRLPTLISRADDRFSLIFASGIVIVLYALFSLFGSGVVGAVAYVIARFAFPQQRDLVFYAVLTVLTAPFLLGGLLDRKGRTLAPRLIPPVRAMQRLSVSLPFMRLTYPLLYTISTNRPRQRTNALMVIAMLVLVFFVMAQVLVRRGVLRIDAYAYIPDQPSAFALEPDHYDDQRRSSGASLPFIQSEVVDGPYLRLFVPYNSERHAPALERECPQLEPFSKTLMRRSPRSALPQSRADASLDCVSRMLGIRLDGAAPARVDLNFGTDARTGLRGYVAMIPLDGVERGRHVLTVKRPPRDRDLPSSSNEKQPAAGDAPASSSAATSTAPATPATEATPENEAKPEPIVDYEIAFWR
jgi:hypothetical protein